MKRVVLVRHGETVWHAENRYAGRTEIALTPKGLVQAAALAEWAATAGLSAVWSSPLLRAASTAEPAAAALSIALRIEPDLVEIDFGDAEGLSLDEMTARFPEARNAFLADPVAHFFPGGEDPNSAVARGMRGLRTIVDALPENGRALVVAHNTLLRLLLSHLLQIPLSRYRRVFPKLANATLTELGFEGDEIALLVFNAPIN